jgi:DNA-directed RNA polymerase
MSSSEHLSAGQDAQRELEDALLKIGQVTHRERTHRLIRKKHESLTDHGKRLLAHAIDPMSEGIRKTIAEAKSRPGRRHAAVKYLEAIDADVASFITARQVIDSITTGSSLQGTAIQIGSRIEEEVQLGRFADEKKFLFEKVIENLKNSPKAYQPHTRRDIVKNAMKKLKIETVDWVLEDKVLLGMKLIEIFIETTGLAEIGTLQSNGKRKREMRRLRATASLLEWIEKYQLQCELLQPQYRPMICPPQPWTSVASGDGGYLTRRCQSPLITRHTRGYMKEAMTADMPVVFNAVNALQATPWKINAKVLAVVESISKSGLALKGFPSHSKIAEIPRPAGELTAEEFKKWHMAAAEAYRSEERRVSRVVQTGQILTLARSYKDRPAIWFPYRLDFRGRMYPAPQQLNPQGTDLAKSLLVFAVGKPLGEGGAWWLLVHAANTFGFDKVSLDDRVQWSKDHMKQIVEVASDPLSSLFWTEADKPFQFLAACFEIAAWKKAGPSYVCSLPVMVDGTANGIQHLSALLLDEDAARHVNMLPAAKPADIYAVVAERVVAALRLQLSTSGKQTDPDKRRYIKTWLEYGITRKLTKRPVMILPYSGTRDGVKGYIKQYVIERSQEENQPHPFGKDLRRACSFLAGVVWEEMNNVVVGPRTAMDWLKEVAKEVNKLGVPLNWTTPSGFPVQQRYLDQSAVRVKTKIGDTIYKVSIRKNGVKLDGRRQQQAISPNFIHSLDAAALVLTVVRCLSEGVTEFAAVHDAYGTQAADMALMLAVLKQEFARMYQEEDLLAKFARQVVPEGVVVPPVPAKGKLNLSSVLESDFFFS